MENKRVKLAIENRAPQLTETLRIAAQKAIDEFNGVQRKRVSDVGREIALGFTVHQPQYPSVALRATIIPEKLKLSYFYIKTKDGNSAMREENGTVELSVTADQQGNLKITRSGQVLTTDEVIQTLLEPVFRG